MKQFCKYMNVSAALTLRTAATMKPRVHFQAKMSVHKVTNFFPSLAYICRKFTENPGLKLYSQRKRIRQSANLGRFLVHLTQI